MSRTLSESALMTPNARLKLKQGMHWRAIDPDIHLGYRRGARGGRWVVRWYLGDQKYSQSPIGTADDSALADGQTCFSFQQAKNSALRIVEAKRAETDLAATGVIPTVEATVLTYIATRDARHSAQGGNGRSDANRRLTRYVVSDKTLCAKALHTLRVADLKAWRKSLPSSLKASTVRRLCNDFRAALNAEVANHQERLPADLSGRIAIGLSAGEDSAPIARDKQALSDDDVRKVIAAAREIDDEEAWSGDLVRMILVLAATGARYSQVRRLQVGDLQSEQLRLLMPTSRKGRGVKKVTHTAIRIGHDVVDVLADASRGRSSGEPLLVRWRHRQARKAVGSGRPVWERDSRGSWGVSSDLTRPWAKIAKRAGLPPSIVPYALRHSSIVRQLRKGLPVQLVARAHDTSAAVIEKHYAAAIVNALDAMSAAAVIPLVETRST